MPEEIKVEMQWNEVGIHPINRLQNEQEFNVDQALINLDINEDAFIDEDDGEKDMEEILEDWARDARMHLNAGLNPPQPPNGLRIERPIQDVIEDMLGPQLDNPPRLNNEPFGGIPAFRRANRGNRMVVDADGRGVPQGIGNPPQPRRMLRHMEAARMPKLNPVYLEEGYSYKGYKFSRKLTPTEQLILANFGYNDVIRSSPDLVFTMKPLSLNDQEECVVIIAELADLLATQRCKERIHEFNIKLHNDIYQEEYKKYLRLVLNFKQTTKNG